MSINDGPEPTNLDGSGLDRGQGQEGKPDPKLYPDYWSIEDCIKYEYYESIWFQNDIHLGRVSRQEQDEYWKMVHEYFDYHDRRAAKAIAEMSLKKKHVNWELGAREFTLTYSPKWYDDEKARELMRQAIDRLIKYYERDIIDLRAVGEVGSNGLSHVHCYYELKGGLKISDKNFKRAYAKWDTSIKTSRSGHQGGHHANVRSLADFKGYIEKEIKDAWLDIKYPCQE